MTVLLDIVFAVGIVVPTLVAFSVLKTGKQSPAKRLGVGVVLVALGTFGIAMGTDLLVEVQKILQYKFAQEAALHISVWVYVFPAVTIGIGVNLLTLFLTTETISKNSTQSSSSSGRAKGRRTVQRKR